MTNYIFSIINTLVLFFCSVGFYFMPEQRVTFTIVVFLYLLIFNSLRLHAHHTHLLSPHLSHVWRLNIYSVVLPSVLWMSTNLLLDFFYGFQFVVIASIGILTLFSIFMLHEHTFLHLKITTHTHQTLEIFSKNIVFFYTTLVAYGYAYLYESIHFLSALQLFWLLFVLSFILMWQSHHKTSKHSIHFSAILVIASWFVAGYGWFIYVMHLPHIAGSLLIAVFYGIVWSIFLHYAKGTLKRDFLYELIALFILVNVVVLTTGSFGQIM